MLVTQRLWAIRDEIVHSMLAARICITRCILLARTYGLAQYDIVFRIPNGSEGHANLYLVNAGNHRTLIVTGQIADHSEGPRVLENDHALAFALGRLWLLGRTRLSAATGEVFHFTADMDSGKLVETWRYGEAAGWRPFPVKLDSIFEVENRFGIRFPSYRGARSPRYGADSIKADDAISLATSIECPVNE
jgi:hypothetical protein